MSDDPRDAEWREHEKKQLKTKTCPYSGLSLVLDEKNIDGRFECPVCDCFGYGAEEIGEKGEPVT